MEFGLPFSFQFKDPDWVKKLLLAALISIIPIVGQLFLLGWGLEITRRIITDDPNVNLLPELEFGKSLGKGFQLFIISLVYSIPLIIFSLPLSIVPGIVSTSDMDTTLATIINIITVVCCGGLSLIYLILFLFMVPAANGNFAAHGNLGAGFRFAEIFGLVRKAIVPYLLVIVGMFIAGIISGLGGIVCGIGVFATMAYAQTIIAHFTGQAYKLAANAPSTAPAM
jgi:hypothetical protein